MRGNGLKLIKERFGLNIRKTFFTGRGCPEKWWMPDLSSIHDQAGWVSDQSDLVGLVPVQDRRVGIDDLYWLYST